ncbi:phytoene synthase [Actimicrobium sp. GrIS 1.19]|uniref:phytoene/squalene synthase family protein n=1 Tax=Actimicrobium sp. GrIS 1.19 TaxID=3071708 RepID=UPI002E03D490|nr:phytoene synthase [Actimicrobium sp. GrIS 1.19]
MPDDADTVLATRGRSFYWARHLLGSRHAARATRLYRFCRYVDDLADEAPSPELAWQALDALGVAIAGQQATNTLVADVLDLMQECAIEPAIMLELIHGVRSDLGEVRFVDETSLLRYCYRVAGTVGIMMCRVLDVQDDAALRHAIDLGIGMQLTNICRDVADDAALGRRYLPATLVGHCEPAALLCPGPMLRPVVTRGVKVLLATAERYYRSGEQGLHYLPTGARAAILVAARLYRAIGRRLGHHSHDYWSGRITVSTAGKIGLTLQALGDLAAGRSANGHGAQHDALLHAPLAGLPLTVFDAVPEHVR